MMVPNRTFSTSDHPVCGTRERSMSTSRPVSWALASTPHRPQPEARCAKVAGVTEVINVIQVVASFR